MSKADRAYQFKVALRHIEPPIWRRILVPAKYTFWDLHVAIQDAMGWLDYHLHMFRVRERESGEIVEIGIPDEDPFEGEAPCMAGWDVRIAKFFTESGDSAEYLYDFGDDWEHLVTLEAIVDQVASTRYPQCLGGSRACPPEDCGGVAGYENVVRVVADPSDEDFENMMEWLGGEFDPERFEPTRVRFDNPKKRWNKAFLDAGA